ncbi:putative HTH-type transcriptional regulator [uncultured archaeon]|nr:putative HTH-type transcriptional regulator [uncultured archaeon]
MKKTDIILISQLRQNGRLPLTELSRKTELPVSTLHERLKKHLESGLIRPGALLDFEKLGFKTRAYILLAAEEKDKLFEHLKEHPNVNTISRINNGWKLIMECVFKDMYSLEEFVEELEKKFKIKQKEIHYVLNEVKREGFFNQEKAAIKLMG